MNSIQLDHLPGLAIEHGDGPSSARLTPRYIVVLAALGATLLAAVLLSLSTMTTGFRGQPWALFVASLYVALPLESRRHLLLQRLVGAYVALQLIMAPGIRLPLHRFGMNLDVSVPTMSIGTVLLAMIAARVVRWSRAEPSGAVFVTAAAILLVHAAVLGSLIMPVYGYGCEGAVPALGKAILSLSFMYAYCCTMTGGTMRLVLGLLNACCALVLAIGGLIT